MTPQVMCLFIYVRSGQSLTSTTAVVIVLCIDAGRHIQEYSSIVLSQFSLRLSYVVLSLVKPIDVNTRNVAREINGTKVALPIRQIRVTDDYDLRVWC